MGSRRGSCKLPYGRAIARYISCVASTLYTSTLLGMAHHFGRKCKGRWVSNMNNQTVLTLVPRVVWQRHRLRRQYYNDHNCLRQLHQQTPGSCGTVVVYKETRTTEFRRNCKQNTKKMRFSPSGRPASFDKDASSIAAPGVFSDGFMTNVLPAATARGNIHSGIIAGKLKGHTPTRGGSSGGGSGGGGGGAG